MLSYLGLPVQASAHAAEIDHMISLVHWLMLLMFIGWGAFFIYVLYRFRRSAPLPRTGFSSDLSELIVPLTAGGQQSIRAGSPMAL